MLFQQNNILCFLGICLLFFFQACTSKQSLTSSNSSSGKNAIFQQIRSNRFTNKWIQYQSKVKVENDQLNGQFSLKTKLKKDALIWMSIKKLNIEGARLQISPKRMEMLDRQRSVYRERSTKGLSETWGLDFESLQRMLTNQPVLYEDRDYSIKQTKTQTIFQSKSKMAVQQQIFYSKEDQQIDSTYIKVESTTLRIAFEDYSLENGIRFPKRWIIHLNSNDQNTKIDLTHKKLTLDKESKMTFSIPDFYERLME